VFSGSSSETRVMSPSQIEPSMESSVDTIVMDSSDQRVKTTIEIRSVSQEVTKNSNTTINLGSQAESKNSNSESSVSNTRSERSETRTSVVAGSYGDVKNLSRVSDAEISDKNTQEGDSKGEDGLENSVEESVRYLLLINCVYLYILIFIFKTLFIKK